MPEDEINLGFNSRYFLILKKGGLLYHILDLRFLNSHLRKYKFRMLTYNVPFRLIQLGNWFTSIDLQDAYFHITTYLGNRKFLSLTFQGVAYEY